MIRTYNNERRSNNKKEYSSSMIGVEVAIPSSVGDNHTNDPVPTRNGSMDYGRWVSNPRSAAADLAADADNGESDDDDEQMSQQSWMSDDDDDDSYENHYHHRRRKKGVSDMPTRQNPLHYNSEQGDSDRRVDLPSPADLGYGYDEPTPATPTRTSGSSPPGNNGSSNNSNNRMTRQGSVTKRFGRFLDTKQPSSRSKFMKQRRAASLSNVCNAAESYCQTMKDLGCPEQLILANNPGGQRMPRRVSLDYGVHPASGGGSARATTSTCARNLFTPKSVSVDFGDSRTTCFACPPTATDCSNNNNNNNNNNLRRALSEARLFSSFRMPRRVSIEYNQTTTTLDSSTHRRSLVLQRRGSLEFSVKTTTLPRKASMGSQGFQGMMMSNSNSTLETTKIMDVDDHAHNEQCSGGGGGGGEEEEEEIRGGIDLTSSSSSSPPPKDYDPTNDKNKKGGDSQPTPPSRRHGSSSPRIHHCQESSSSSSSKHSRGGHVVKQQADSMIANNNNSDKQHGGDAQPKAPSRHDSGFSVLTTGSSSSTQNSKQSYYEGCDNGMQQQQGGSSNDDSDNQGDIQPKAPSRHDSGFSALTMDSGQNSKYQHEGCDNVQQGSSSQNNDNQGGGDAQPKAPSRHDSGFSVLTVGSSTSQKRKQQQVESDTKEQGGSAKNDDNQGDIQPKAPSRHDSGFSVLSGDSSNHQKCKQYNICDIKQGSNRGSNDDTKPIAPSRHESSNSILTISSSSKEEGMESGGGCDLQQQDSSSTNDDKLVDSRPKAPSRHDSGPSIITISSQENREYEGCYKQQKGRVVATDDLQQCDDTKPKVPSRHDSSQSILTIGSSNEGMQQSGECVMQQDSSSSGANNGKQVDNQPKAPNRHDSGTSILQVNAKEKCGDRDIIQHDGRVAGDHKQDAQPKAPSRHHSGPSIDSSRETGGCDTQEGRATIDDKQVDDTKPNAPSRHDSYQSTFSREDDDDDCIPELTLADFVKQADAALTETKTFLEELEMTPILPNQLGIVDSSKSSPSSITNSVVPQKEMAVMIQYQSTQKLGGKQSSRDSITSPSA